MDIIWTAPAKKSLFETVHYVRRRMGSKIARDVQTLIVEQVNLLRLNPYMGKSEKDFSTDRFNFRFVVINKRSKVYYFVEDEYIYIVLVWDTRQSLELLKERLSSLF